MGGLRDRRDARCRTRNQHSEREQHSLLALFPGHHGAARAAPPRKNVVFRGPHPNSVPVASSRVLVAFLGFFFGSAWAWGGSVRGASEEAWGVLWPQGVRTGEGCGCGDDDVRATLDQLFAFLGQRQRGLGPRRSRGFERRSETQSCGRSSSGIRRGEWGWFPWGGRVHRWQVVLMSTRSRRTQRRGCRAAKGRYTAFLCEDFRRVVGVWVTGRRGLAAVGVRVPGRRSFAAARSRAWARPS